jgi:F0F1-type ATP synthase delta subunit
VVSSKDNLSKEKNAALKSLVEGHRVDAYEHLRTLVNQKGYSYAKEIAKEIKDEFKCKPGDEKWQVYSTVTWALDTFFHKLENRAVHPPKDANANY